MSGQTMDQQQVLQQQQQGHYGQQPSNSSMPMQQQQQQQQQAVMQPMPPMQQQMHMPLSLGPGPSSHDRPPAHFVLQQDVIGRGAPPAPSGPLKQFQSTHMQRTQMWMQDHYGDSGIQTMASSAAPSVHSNMSGLSLPDDASVMSGYLTEEQQQRFVNLPYCGSQQSDTMLDPHAFAAAIPEVIGLLADEDPEIVTKATHMVYRFAKFEASPSQQHVQSAAVKGPELVESLMNVILTHDKKEIVNNALGSLFHMSTRPDTLSILNLVVFKSKGQLIFEIVKRMGSTNHAYNNYALLTLHSLLEQEPIGSRQARAFARQANALVNIVSRLDGHNEKHLTIAIDCARHIYQHNTDQKLIFVQLGGPAKLVTILRSFNYEKLLYTTSSALKALADCSQAGTSTAQAIVDAGGIQALSLRLDHASQRLVIASLECLCAISDVRTDTDVRETLGKLLQLLGVTDGRVVLHCLGILANMAANNPRNKEFLYKSKAVAWLLRVLRAAYVENLNYLSPMQLEEVQEMALMTLRNLTTGFDGADLAQQELIQTPGAVQLYLRSLINMRPKILKQTLMILNRASQYEANLPFLRDAFDDNPEENFVSAVSRAVSVAHGQRSTMNANEVEGVKMSDLLSPGLATLQNLSHEPLLFRQILDLSKKERSETEQLKPMQILSQATEENVRRSALGFLHEMAREPNVAGQLLADSNALHLFQTFAQSQSQAIATYARGILDQLQMHRQQSGTMGDDFYYLPDGLQDFNDPFANFLVQNASLDDMATAAAPTQQILPYPSPMMDLDNQMGSPSSPMQHLQLGSS
uniref:Beta-catenin n=1 Tax=Plectus sambesii TaxID=2011161 RepID=A0A914WYI5_9BILA